MTSCNVAHFQLHRLACILCCLYCIKSCCACFILLSLDVSIQNWLSYCAGKGKASCVSDIDNDICLELQRIQQLYGSKEEKITLSDMWKQAVDNTILIYEKSNVSLL